MLIHGLLAAIGGVVRELKNPETSRGIDFFVGALIGVFCGVVVYFLCKNYGCSDYLTAAFTSLAGYIGTPILDMITKVVKKLLTVKFGDSDNS
jgi:hypothetical protein